jgi:hypothetical protein
MKFQLFLPQLVANCTQVLERQPVDSYLQAIVAEQFLLQNGQAMERSEYEAHVAYGGVAERRRTIRFPVSEELKYRVLHKSVPISGAGKALNICSGGLLFTTEEKLPIGRQVEISLNWPARLDGTCPLKFVASGRVVRAETCQAAVRIERYEFRTRSSSGELAKSATAD